MQPQRCMRRPAAAKKPHSNRPPQTTYFFCYCEWIIAHPAATPHATRRSVFERSGRRLFLNYARMGRTGFVFGAVHRMGANPVYAGWIYSALPDKFQSSCRSNHSHKFRKMLQNVAIMQTKRKQLPTLSSCTRNSRKHVHGPKGPWCKGSSDAGDL